MPKEKKNYNYYLKKINHLVETLAHRNKIPKVEVSPYCFPMIFKNIDIKKRQQILILLKNIILVQVFTTLIQSQD